MQSGAAILVFFLVAALAGLVGLGVLTATTPRVGTKRAARGAARTKGAARLNAAARLQNAARPVAQWTAPRLRGNLIDCFTEVEQDSMLVVWEDQVTGNTAQPEMLGGAVIQDHGIIQLTPDTPQTMGAARFLCGNPGPFWRLSFVMRYYQNNLQAHAGDEFWVCMYADPDEYAPAPVSGLCLSFYKTWGDNGLSWGVRIYTDGIVMHDVDTPLMTTNVPVIMDFNEGELILTVDGHQIFTYVDDSDVVTRASYRECQTSLIFGAWCGANSEEKSVSHIELITL